MEKIGNKGFTLVELLITVAIISLLASIAVINYNRAQIRAKVSRTKAELQILATALESYYGDNNAYPRWIEVAENLEFGEYYMTPVSWRLHALTTPVTYLSLIPSVDPFQTQKSIDLSNSSDIYDTYDYIDAASSIDAKGQSQENIARSIYGRMWRLSGSGPDRMQSYGRSDYSGSPPNIIWLDFGFYDPTNGIVSNGDIVRLGPPSAYYRDWELGFEPG